MSDKYCHKCGSELEITVEEYGETMYDTSTGKPFRYRQTEIACPNRGRWFTNGHYYYASTDDPADQIGWI